MTEPDYTDRLSEPVDRYIKQFGNPINEAEAVAMYQAIDPTLDMIDASEHAYDDMHFVFVGDDDENPDALIVPLAQVLGIPARGQDAHESDVLMLAYFWPQLTAALKVEDGWEFPPEGVDGDKITTLGIASLHLFKMQSGWLHALAQWMSAYTGKLMRSDPRENGA